MKKWLVIGSFLLSAHAEATCERVSIHAMGWFVTTLTAQTPDSLRQREEGAIITKDPAEISAIMTKLKTALSAPQVKDPTDRLDTRLVVDCFKADGSVEVYAASALELRQPPSGKIVALDENFRKFFTLDKDFQKRLKP